MHQVRASAGNAQDAGTPNSASDRPAPLDVDDLSILTGSAQGIAEALAHAPDRTSRLLGDAYPDAPWRDGIGLGPPYRPFTDAIDSMARLVWGLAPDGTSWNDVLEAIQATPSTTRQSTPR